MVLRKSKPKSKSSRMRLLDTMEDHCRYCYDMLTMYELKDEKTPDSVFQQLKNKLKKAQRILISLKKEG